jgi:hypothetical protein
MTQLKTVIPPVVTLRRNNPALERLLAQQMRPTGI